MPPDWLGKNVQNAPAAGGLFQLRATLAAHIKYFHTARRADVKWGVTDVNSARRANLHCWNARTQRWTIVLESVCGWVKTAAVPYIQRSVFAYASFLVPKRPHARSTQSTKKSAPSDQNFNSSAAQKVSTGAGKRASFEWKIRRGARVIASASDCGRASTQLELILYKRGKKRSSLSQYYF